MTDNNFKKLHYLVDMCSFADSISDDKAQAAHADQEKETWSRKQNRINALDAECLAIEETDDYIYSMIEYLKGLLEELQSHYWDNIREMALLGDEDCMKLVREINKQNQMS